jgi:hypothetical protein
MNWLLAYGITLPFVVQPSVDVDKLEVNHFYDTKGGYVYTQVIPWVSRYGDYGRMDSQGFKIAGTFSRDGVVRLPSKVGSYYVFSYKTSKGCTASVRAPILCETYTQHDPETVDRQRQRRLNHELVDIFIELEKNHGEAKTD